MTGVHAIESHVFKPHRIYYTSTAVISFVVLDIAVKGISDVVICIEIDTKVTTTGLNSENFSKRLSDLLNLLTKTSDTRLQLRNYSIFLYIIASHENQN